MSAFPPDDPGLSSSLLQRSATNLLADVQNALRAECPWAGKDEHDDMFKAFAASATLGDIPDYEEDPQTAKEVFESAESEQWLAGVQECQQY